MFLGRNHGMKFESHNSADSDDLHERQKNDPPVHFLLDEVPQEIFTSKYSAAFAEGLKNYFEHSTVVIALQSVRKVREIQSVNKPNELKPDQTDMEPLTNSGVIIFELKTCVRMSSQLYELQKNLEAEAEKTPFHANLAYKQEKGITCFFAYKDTPKY